MQLNRRKFAKSATLGAAVLVSADRATGEEAPAAVNRRNPIAVSTYSFWRFKEDSKLSIERYIDEAARIGFDAVEILHIQMESEDSGYLQRLKRRAFVNGLDLCGFSTHQGFVTPNAEKRQKNIDHTIHAIELAYQLGIPTMRVNTGRWGNEQRLRRTHGKSWNRTATSWLHRRRWFQMGHRFAWQVLARCRKVWGDHGIGEPLGSGINSRRRIANRRCDRLTLAEVYTRYW